MNPSNPRDKFHKSFAHFGCATLCIVFMITTWSRADDIENLSRMSLEELMNVEVTSVSKRSEKLSEAPAAITVITSEDIRRSGYSTIPDVLRLVPGMEVARIDLNSWAISARGFNGQFASKLLVLIDGRSVYSPLYSGVYWDAQDVMLEDVERIEVIRGPGATMWGANAVNGVINITTKSAEASQGTLVSAGGGSAEHYGFRARHGGLINNQFAYRVFVKSFDRFQNADATSANSDDRWQVARTGFRLDGPVSKHSEIALSSEAYSGLSGYATTTPTISAPYQSLSVSNNPISGGHLLASYRTVTSPSSNIELKTYVDRLTQDFQSATDQRTTLDFDLHQNFNAGNRHALVWGSGFRYTWDHVLSSDVLTVAHDRTESQIISAFAQDEILLAAEKLWLTVGSKAEHNDYTGLEIQPNLRLALAPAGNSRIWAAVSRAARTPSRGESDAVVNLVSVPPFSPDNPSPLPVMATFHGSENMNSEILIAYELGFRLQPAQNLGFAATGFFHDYDRLRFAQINAPIIHMESPVPYVESPSSLTNDLFGNSQGFEIESELHLRSDWKLAANYSFLHADFFLKNPVPSAAGNPLESITENIIPNHQAVMRSAWDLGRRFELDITGRYVSKLTNSTISDYATADCRVGYQAFSGFEFFAAGQNLIGPAHHEFDSPLTLQTLKAQTERTLYLGATWTFRNANNKVQISKR